MKYNILQIMPAPKGMMAKYTLSEEEHMLERVLCLALVEDEDGDRSIEPVDFCEDGAFVLCIENGNLEGYCFKDE